jgi:hypothetical protein
MPAEQFISRRISWRPLKILSEGSDHARRTL